MLTFLPCIFIICIMNQQMHNRSTIYCTALYYIGFPLQMIQNLKSKIKKTQKAKNTRTQTQRKKWITFTYYSPIIHKVTNLFKCSELNILFRTRNTLYNKIRDRPTQSKTDSSGIYGLKFKKS